jgi:hypothetical protein
MKDDTDFPEGGIVMTMIYAGNDMLQKKIGYYKEIRNPLRQLRRNTFILSQYLRQEGCREWLNACTVFPNRNAWWAKGRPEQCLDTKEELLRYLTTPKRQPLDEAAVRRSVEILKKCVQERPVLTRAEFNTRLARTA